MRFDEGAARCRQHATRLDPDRLHERLEPRQVRLDARGHRLRRAAVGHEARSREPLGHCGSASAFFISALSLATIAGGVSRRREQREVGRHQDVVAAPASVIVGTSGNMAKRFSAADRERAQAPVLDEALHRRHGRDRRRRLRPPPPPAPPGPRPCTARAACPCPSSG